MFGLLRDRPRADGWWRAGPVAGHGLRLRRLRLRGVSRATRPGIVFAWPGSLASVAVRGRYCLRGRSSCAGSTRAALRRSDAATVVCLRVGEPTGAPASPRQGASTTAPGSCRPSSRSHFGARSRSRRSRSQSHRRPRLRSPVGRPAIALAVLAGLTHTHAVSSRNSSAGRDMRCGCAPAHRHVPDATGRSHTSPSHGGTSWHARRPPGIGCSSSKSHFGACRSHRSRSCSGRRCKSAEGDPPAHSTHGTEQSAGRCCLSTDAGAGRPPITRWRTLAARPQREP
jgi:hypothetical protein